MLLKINPGETSSDHNDTVSQPAFIFKVNKENSITTCQRRRSGVCIVNFEQISHILMISPLSSMKMRILYLVKNS